MYILFIGNLLKQSAVVWHSSLTEEERIQKTACKIILWDKFKDYEQALLQLDLDNLHDRRTLLCLNLARKSWQKSKNLRHVPKQITISIKWKQEALKNFKYSMQILKGYWNHPSFTCKTYYSFAEWMWMQFWTTPCNPVFTLYRL